MGLIYLVRHAHADWSPDEQRPLSKRGQADAVRVAELLASRTIRAVYSSPFARARQTVEPLALRLGLSIVEDDELRERRVSSEPVQDFETAIKTLWEKPTFAFPGGESNVAAQQRGVAILRRLADQHLHESVVVATHGNLLALMLQSVDKAVDFAFWRSMTMPAIYLLNSDHIQR